MPYFYNTSEDQQAMLAAVGAKSIDELFDCVPSEYRLQRPLNLPPALSELELSQHLAELAARMSADGPDSPPHLAAAVDFVLEGLHAQKRISRTDSGRLYATAPVREDPRRSIEALMDDDEEDTPTGGRKKKYYN